MLLAIASEPRFIIPPAGRTTVSRTAQPNACGTVCGTLTLTLGACARLSARLAGSLWGLGRMQGVFYMLMKRVMSAALPMCDTNSNKINLHRVARRAGVVKVGHLASGLLPSRRYRLEIQTQVDHGFG